ncbi:protein translocase subunit SecD [Arsenicicoccus dermatophilus]|uniref:protein translocase subunit SecD n=1 Tax=Arsenicicoccus dermatophilus TaxID=1076331 RepID=UPI003916FD71
MARNPRTRGARRTLTWFFVLLLGLYALLAGVTTWGSAQWTPKLGLDLAGGTQVVLAPQVQGGQALDESRMNEAVNIMQKRVDGSGVAEAEVSTQGGRNIVVNLPKGTPQETVDSLKKSSMMRFRPVLIEAVGAATPQPTATASGVPVPGATAPAATPATPTATPTKPVVTPAKPVVTPAKPAGTPAKPVVTPAKPPASPAKPAATATPSSAGALVPPAAAQLAPRATATATAPAPAATPVKPAATPAKPPATSVKPAAPAVKPAGPASTPTATTPAGPLAPAATTPGAAPKDASDPAWITPELQAQFEKLNCTDKNLDLKVDDDPKKPIVTCSTDRRDKYILGPAELEGADIADATAGLQPTQGGGTGTEYGVNLTLTGDGGKKFADLSKRLLTLPQPRNQFASVLDGEVIVAPRITVPIYDGKSSITGGFTDASSQSLAQQLKFGALPMSFRVETQDTVSPTLGADQLQKGLLAGLAGFLLVCLYALFQYRALGLVTIASLLAAAALTYVSITLLGWSQNFRLSMAGVTGLILSIGMTADSFIIYFERVRDEIREGRSIPAAVEAGWQRAKGTVIISDLVNLIAAVVLYLLASSNVRGFAYTLGLTTLIDVVIVFLFTHPMLALLSRTRFFGEGHPMSGFDPKALGAKPARYRGRGQFRDPDAELAALEAEREAARGRDASYSKEGGAVL